MSIMVVVSGLNVVQLKVHQTSQMFVCFMLTKSAGSFSKLSSSESQSLFITKNWGNVKF